MPRWRCGRTPRLNREISKRAACERYKLHWGTPEQILAHVTVMKDAVRAWKQSLREFFVLLSHPWGRPGSHCS